MSNGSSKRSSGSGSGPRKRRSADAPSDGAGSNGHDPEEAGERVAGALGASRLDPLASAAKGLTGLAASALSAVADEAMARVPRADLDERDPDYIREQLPGLWLLASLYFRAEVRGLQNIPPEGPV